MSGIHSESCSRFSELHSYEKRRLRKEFEALAEVLDIIVPNKAEVRGLGDEGFGIFNESLFDQVGPELFRNLEHLRDFEGFGRLDGAILVLRGVVEFAEGGVSGPCVVPRIGAFQCDSVEALVDLNFEGRMELFEDDPEGGAHDAGPDEDDVRVRRWFVVPVEDVGEAHGRRVKEGG